MSFTETVQLPDLDTLKDLPGYRAILKTVLKSQIKMLVEQLSAHTGEESLLLTASVSDGTLSHVGSEFGQVFLDNHMEFKSKFLGFCLSRHQIKTSTVKSQKLYNTQPKYTSSDQSDSGNNISVHPVSLHQFSNPETSVRLSQTEVTHTNRSSHQNSHVTTTPCAFRKKMKSESVIDKVSDIAESDIYSDIKVERNMSNGDCGGITKSSMADGFCGGSDDNNDGYYGDDDVGDDAELRRHKLTDNFEVNDIQTTSEMGDHAMVIIKKEPGLDTYHVESNDFEGTNTAGDSSGSLTGPSLEEDTAENSLLRNMNFSRTSDSTWMLDRPYPRFGVKRKLKNATFETKYKAIEAVESGIKSRSSIAKEFDIPQSTLSTWVKHAEEIKQNYLTSGYGAQRMKRRRSKHPDIDEPLLNWIRSAEEQNKGRVSSVILLEKANEIARQLGYTESQFSCTIGWLDRFKVRCGLRSNRLITNAE